MLRVVELKKRYRSRDWLGRAGAEVAALDGVSLACAAGEVVGLTGESGSGKSTLARCVAGFEKADSGVIERGGKVQLVLQDSGSSFSPWMTVEEALVEPLVIGQVQDRRERWRAVMKRVRLGEGLLGKKPGQLSGGERQRLALGRALLAEPEILVMDETFSALDHRLQGELCEVVKGLGKTCLFISHDLNLIRQLTERIHVLERGRMADERLGELEAAVLGWP